MNGRGPPAGSRKLVVDGPHGDAQQYRELAYGWFALSSWESRRRARLAETATFTAGRPSVGKERR